MPLLFHNFHIVSQYECFMIIMKTQVHENENDSSAKISIHRENSNTTSKRTWLPFEILELSC